MLLVFFLATAARGEMLAWPEAYIDDADLHAVTFLDDQKGWAVGDRGAIWHTRDGGVQWEILPSPTTASLRAVAFADPQHGWIVGGTAVPYSQRGSGVVLRTDDGGATWLRERRVELPFLRAVHFDDQQHGIAVGDGSPLFPAGIYTTRDAGRMWNPIAVRGDEGWIAADCHEPNRVALSRNGKIVVFDGQQGIPATTPAGYRRMRAVTRLDHRTLFAVGDGGSLWISRDGGHHWKNASHRLRHLNVGTGVLRTVTCREQQVWIGGMIGGRILHSPDAGQTWQAIAISSSTPINDIAFTDAEHGWAVGALGSILSTVDGGRSWHSNRGDQRRLAVLGIFASEDDIPWPAFAQSSSVYDARSRLVVCQQRADTPYSVSLEERLHQAALRCGANGASTWDEFPLGNPEIAVDGGIVADHWDRLHESRGDALAGVQRLRQNIRHQLAVWRPDVVITSPLPSGDAESQEANIRRLMQIVILDEAARSGIRVRRATANPHAASTNIAASELSVAMGSSVGQLASAASGFLHDRPETTAHLTAIEPLSGQSGGKSVLHGIANEPGGAARRAATPPAADNWQDLQRQTQRYMSALALIDQAAQSPEKAAAWQTQLESMMAGIAPDEAARLLYAMGHAHLRHGHWEAALRAFDRLARKYPQSQVARVALVNALHVVCSAEANRLRQRVTVPSESAKPKATVQEPVSQVAQTTSEFRDARTIPIDSLVKTGPTIAKQMATKSPRSIHTAKHDGQSAELWKVATWSDRMDPLTKAEPEITFAMESFRRLTIQPGKRQQGVYRRLARTSITQDWRVTASAELALLQPEREILKLTYSLAQGPRPRLDGKLDDPLWQASEPIQLADHRDNLRNPATTAYAKMAYDAEYLYLGFVVGVEPSVTYADDAATRKRDTDLDSHDRIDIHIDIDRDYQTAWRLTIDHRGWANERLMHFEGWNPQWHIAATPTRSDRSQWTVEAAMPRSELSDSAPTATNPWSVSIRRLLPGVGRQSWPADSDSPSDSAFVWFTGEE